MLPAFQGQVQNDTILLNPEDIRPFNGRIVTVIVNDPIIEKNEKVASKRQQYLAKHRATAVPSGRSTEEIDTYIKESRENDRF